jgi:hypothetical protein
MFLIALAAITGIRILAEKSAKIFIRAVASKNYPGQIKPLSNIEKISKWSG